MPRYGPYLNPDSLDDLNPGELYRDGILESYVNPVVVKSWRGAGAAYTPPSDYRKTVAEPHRPGSKDRHRQGMGFARDITGDPWGSTDPGWTQGGGPSGPEPNILQAHNSSPENTAEKRTLSGLAAIPAKKQLPDSVANNSVTRFVTGLWQSSPVASLFFALAALLVINSLFLRNRRIGRAVRSTGTAASAPSRAATGTAAAAMDGVNNSVAAAVHAVDDIAPGQ